MSNSDYKAKKFKAGYEGLFGKSYSTFEEYLKLNTEWYINQIGTVGSLYIKRNKEFN